MRDKNILLPQEIDFLRKLHNDVRFDVKGEIYKLRNGVHQGSPIYPAMFNIYLEFVMRKIKESL
jgi:hypothetical protein